MLAGSKNFPNNFPSAIVAFGTLMLAIATFQLINNSNAQEKRRRGDELAKERRLRDKEMLDEIIVWALDITKCTIPSEATSIAGIKDAKTDRMVAIAHWNLLVNEFQEVIGKGIYTQRISLAFDEKLKSVVIELSKILDIHLTFIYKCRDATARNSLPAVKSSADELTKNWEVLANLVKRVIDEAYIEKCNILNF